MSIVAGLDISTSEIGICLLDQETKEIVLMRSLSLNKELNLKQKDQKTNVETLIKKTKVFKNTIGFLIKQFGVEHIFIEDFLMAYTFGRTSKQTLIALAQFNGMCQYCLANDFSLVPYDMISVSTARKLTIGKIPRTTGLTQKEYVFDWFKANVDHDIPNAKNSRDMVDAYVIAYGGIESAMK